MAFVANRAMMAPVYPHLVHRQWVGVRQYRSSLEHAKHKGAPAAQECRAQKSERQICSSRCADRVRKPENPLASMVCPFVVIALP